VVDPPDTGYWAALGIILVPAGAGLKYLVWDFLQMPDTLHSRFSTALTEAHATIHERRFLPTLVQIYDQVAARKMLLPAASTTDILVELPIDAQVREAMAVVSERALLDRTFQRAIGPCPWVGISWLIVICASIILFFVDRHSASGWKTTWGWGLICAIAIASLAGMTSFGLFLMARNRLIRILGANRF
jgi:hypothetical protein